MLWNFLSPTIWGQEGIVCFVDIGVMADFILMLSL
jgi:hypothetical protein